MRKTRLEAGKDWEMSRFWRHMCWACALAIGLSSAMAQEDAEPVKDKPVTAQQQKMKHCNAEAKSKSLKGEERKKFMSTCLSKS